MTTTDYPHNKTPLDRITPIRAEVAHLHGVRQRDFERALCAGTDDRR